jgi:diguanylate cyclase (GGDEF)-like protein/PAS domain S-box-containing protein
MDLACEWESPGTRKIFEATGNHLHPFAPDFARWIEVLGSGQLISGAVSSLPRPERRVLANERVVCTAVAPIFVRGEWWGFIGVDDCAEVRSWTQAELDALRRTADAFGESIGRVHDEQIQRLTEEQFRSMVEHGPAITYIDASDEAATTLYISPQIQDVLGYAPGEWLADPQMWTRVLHPDDRARAISENTRHNVTGEPFRAEYRVFAKDGRVVWVHDEAIMLAGEPGEPGFSHGVMMDVTERKRGEEQVAYHAYHDDLTGALRREMGEVALQHEVDRARRGDGRLVLAFVDVDGLKSLNDRAGHLAGDALLKGVVATMRAKLRSFDPVVRYGGDEFVCALVGTVPEEAVGRFADIQDELAREYDKAGISVGVVELKADETLDDLIARGDAALYKAKGRARH